MKKMLIALPLALAVMFTATACTAAPEEAADEVTLIGDYDKSTLADFSYSEVLNRAAMSFSDDLGDFLDELGYGEFKELYERAYRLAAVMTFPDDFPITFDYFRSVKWDDAVQIQVTDEDYAMDCYTYYLTGYSWDSFYSEMLSVFTKEQADELISMYKLFYNYDGALWYSPGASGADLTRVHTEYTAEKTDDTFDIIRTSYHVPLGTTPEFDPEKIDEYETKMTHFTFINTENGWRASEFADIR